MKPNVRNNPELLGTQYGQENIYFQREGGMGNMKTILLPAAH